MDSPVDWPTRDLLTHRAATTPDRTALVDAERDETWTYRTFDERVENRAAALTAVTPVNRPTVAVLADDPLVVAESVFAVMRLGGRVVPLNTRLTRQELAAQCDRLDIDCLVCDAATETTAVEVGVTQVYTVDTPQTADAVALTAPADAAVDPEPLDRGTELLVLFTSGTTGRPKGVRLAVGNLVASATASAWRLGVLPDDRWLCCLPTYHMGGLAPIFRSVLYGTTAVVQDGFGAEETAEVMADETITGVSLVPTMLGRLLDTGWTPPDHLRFVLLGGAPAPETLLQRCADTGVPVHPTYGMTETASQVATATPEQVSAHEGTVGQPLVCTDVTVVDESGAVCDPGTRGELVVDGPTVTPGYLDEETTDAAFGEFGLHTGDIGYRDESGRLWVCNRVDDRIITGGENVDPGEVVETLRSHPEVEDAAVVGIDDAVWGERVAALVVTGSGSSLAAADVERHCRAELAGYKIPRTIAFAERLPRTASGTVDRPAVRDRL